MPTWLVTGGSGFLGRHLLATLEGFRPSIQVVALGRNRPPGVPPERFEPADLDDPSAVARALAEARPDVVFHLAGRTPPASPEALFRANVRATDHLVAGLLALDRHPVRLVVAGSAAELGPVPVDRLPAREDLPCRPADAYGLSKWFATRRALAAGGAIETVAARVFNPIGPGLPTSQAFGRFAAALAGPSGPGEDDENGLVLRVGDLDARRDFIDARDVAAALVALAVRGTPGQVYHVGTGESHRVGDGLDLLIALAGRPVEVIEQVFARRGPSDSRACVARLRTDTGWAPRYPLEASLTDLWAEALSCSERPSISIPGARRWPKAG